MKLKATLTALLALAVAVPVGATLFSDVDDHPRRSDIQYVANQEWFEGYPDGRFDPEGRITPTQMLAVLNRAFPDGMNRGQFASFLRAGEEAVGDIATTTTTISSTSTTAAPVPETTTTTAAATTTTTTEPPLTADSPPLRGDAGWRPTISNIRVWETRGHGPDANPNHRICVDWQVSTVGTPEILMTEWGTDTAGTWFYSRPRFQHWFEWVALVDGQWKDIDDVAFWWDAPAPVIDYPGGGWCGGSFEFSDEIQAVVIKAIAKPVVTDNIIKGLLPAEFHNLRVEATHCQRIPGVERWINNPPPLRGWAADACRGKL